MLTAALVKSTFPKAVMVEHGNLLHTLRAGQALFGLGPGDTVACLSPFTFDISFFELLAPLLAGGRLVLMDLRPAPDLDRLDERRQSVRAAWHWLRVRP